MGRVEILKLLGSGEWVSGQEMAELQGVSRAAVWKQIQSLRKRGYEILASPKKGYRLTNQPDILDAEMVRTSLKTRWLGKDMRSFWELPSTNELAGKIARDFENGTVILAEIQTKGKGRLSRTWVSPPGGIWMSLILKPKMPLAQAYQLNMAVSVALSRTIQTLYGLDARIKWPNDILINERKVCGILMEVSAEVDRLDYAVAGVGINANVDVSVFPSEWKSTSLIYELGRIVDRVELVAKILQEIEDTYEKIGSIDIYEEWRKRSATLGKNVRITSMAGDLIGVAEDLTRDGALCIKTKDGHKRVLAGDCIHLRFAEDS